MYKIEKGKPFYFILKTLMYSYSFPQSIEKSQLKRFWFKFTVVKLLALLAAIIQPLLHTIMAFKNKTGIDVSEDCAVLIGSFCVLSVSFLFTLQFTKWTDLLNDVTCFDDGDISGFGKQIKYFNISTIVYYIFCIVGTIIYGIIRFSTITACNQLNEERNLHEICGTFYAVWLPVRSINLMSIIIISVSQTIICFTILPVGAMITFLLWESTEILIIHINILNEMFTNLFENPGEITDKLRICINYHVRILSLANRLNILVMRSISHMSFLAALVFGFILNQVIRSAAVNGIIFLIGYITAIFVICHSGERIKNETVTIGDAIWASNWHKADAKIMKDLAFIMFRSQKPICFEAVPLGIFDYSLFIMILKTSYSYLTLLNQTV